MIMESFELETLIKSKAGKSLYLIIYDISENKHRLKISKLLESYGTRIQKSSFEAWLTKKKFEGLLTALRKIIYTTDNIRIYKLHGYNEVTILGKQGYIDCDEVMIV